jgi:hypothetical protein
MDINGVVWAKFWSNPFEILRAQFYGNQANIDCGDQALCNFLSKDKIFLICFNFGCKM